MSTVNELMGSICQKTNNKLTHTCIDMLDEHIYFFLQYIGQSFLTGNRSVSLNKTKKEKKNIHLARYLQVIFRGGQGTEDPSYIIPNLLDRVV
jgi:hypothetical protein